MTSALIFQHLRRRCAQPQVYTRSLHTSPCAHGLQEFIESSRYTRTGRPWSRNELRVKSDEDLEKLWWVCLKERNLLATLKYREETAFHGGDDRQYGTSRPGKVQRTMKNIKWVLRERELKRERHAAEQEYKQMVADLEELVHTDPSVKEEVEKVVLKNE